MKSLLLLFCCPVPQIRLKTENVNFPSAHARLGERMDLHQLRF